MPNFKQLLDAAMKPLSTNANSPANSLITIDAGSASFVSFLPSVHLDLTTTEVCHA